MKRVQLSNEKKQEILSKWDAGASATKLGKEYGFSSNSLYNWVAQRKSGRKPKKIVMAKTKQPAKVAAPQPHTIILHETTAGIGTDQEFKKLIKLMVDRYL